MELKDIEQRAEECYYTAIGGKENHSEGSNCDDNFRSGFITGYQKAILEERERGKRFNYWTRIFGYEYSMDLEEFRNDNDYEKRWTYEQLFDKFISEEK